jgi:hypothetical protein
MVDMPWNSGEPNQPPYLWWRTRRIVEFQSFPGYSSKRVLLCVVGPAACPVYGYVGR